MTPTSRRRPTFTPASPAPVIPRFHGCDAGPINHYDKGRCFPMPSDTASLADHLAVVRYDPYAEPRGAKPHQSEPDDD